VATRDIDSLERNIAQAKAAAIANGTNAVTRKQTLELRWVISLVSRSHRSSPTDCWDRYREQTDKASRLKEEIVRAIIKNSHDIAMFKEEVSRHLTELRDFAEAD
jgi:kinetochore protein NDC80